MSLPVPEPAHLRLTDAVLVERASRVIETTASAWRVAPVSPRAAARRAPHGYVPVRILRRLRAAAAAAAGPSTFAHSW